MKHKRAPGVGKPVLLRGGPLNNSVMQAADLYNELMFPIQSEFNDITAVTRVSAQQPAWAEPTAESMKITVAVYRRSGKETSLQLPFPAPEEARRVGYEYTYDRTETT